MRNTAIALCLSLSWTGCCHLDRLSEPGAIPQSVSLQAAGPPAIELAFTRAIHRRNLALVAGRGSTGAASVQFRPMLDGLAGAPVAAALLRVLPSPLQRRLGWQVTDEAPARFTVEAQGLLLAAPDMVSSLEARWTLRLQLQTPDGRVVWRDCVEWTLDVEGVSMQGWGAQDQAEQMRLLDRLVAPLAEQIAMYLAQAGAALSR